MKKRIKRIIKVGETLLWNFIRLRGLIPAFLFMAALLYWTMRQGPRGLQLLTPHIGFRGVQTLVSLAILGAGVFAFWFKRKRQLWYALFEVAFGSASGVNISFSTAHSGPLFAQWAAMVGCAYVIARGLNNFAEAKDKEAAILRRPKTATESYSSLSTDPKFS
jgi:hypothetical protein